MEYPLLSSTVYMNEVCMDLSYMKKIGGFIVISEIDYKKKELIFIFISDIFC